MTERKKRSMTIFVGTKMTTSRYAIMLKLWRTRYMQAFIGAKLVVTGQQRTPY